MTEDKVFWVTTGYGARTRQPFVQLRFLDDSHQMSPEDARRIAQNLIEGAESAEQDAFLIECAKRNLGSLEAGAKLVATFREWREERSKNRK